MLLTARRLAYPSLERLGDVLVDDVAVPLSHLSEMFRRIEAIAATLAANIVRTRTGRGPRTRLSRRSGSTAFQAITANKPTRPMVVAIRNS